MGYEISATEIDKPLQITPFSKHNENIKVTNKNEKTLHIKSSIK